MGPPNTQQPQQHQHDKNKRFNKWKKFHKGGGGGGGQHQGNKGFRRTQQMQQAEVVVFDFNTFPADLDEAQLAELEAALQPEKRAKSKSEEELEPLEHSELQARNLSDLFEVAEEEGVELANARTRRDVIFEITAKRLKDAPRSSPKASSPSRRATTCCAPSATTTCRPSTTSSCRPPSSRSTRSCPA
jgi:hypothetical protein